MKMMQAVCWMSNSHESWLFSGCSRMGPMVHWTIQNLREDRRLPGSGFQLESRLPNLVAAPKHTTSQRTETTIKGERAGFFLNRFRVFIGTRKF